MNSHAIILGILLFIQYGFVHSQSGPQWLYEFPRVDGNFYRPVSIMELNDDAFVLCQEFDTICIDYHYAVLHFTNSGQWIDTTHYGKFSCQQVEASRIVNRYNRIQVSVDDSAQMLNAHGKIHIYNASLNRLDTICTAKTAHGLTINARDGKIHVFSDNSGSILYQFDTSGNCEWQINEPLLFGQSNYNYHELYANSNLLYAVSMGNTNSSQTTSQLVVTVIDTLGNIIDTLVTDPFPSAGEAISSTSHHQNGFLYCAIESFANGRTRAGRLDYMGNPAWNLTLNENARFSCYDPVVDQLFIVTCPQAFSTNYKLFRIQATTGQVIDSVAIDSVYGGPNGVSFSHAIGVGIYICHRNSTTSSTYVINRYNIYGNNDWTGIFSISAQPFGTFQKISADTVGNVYVSGWFTDSFYICRFAAPPLGLMSPEQGNSLISVFPNPASTTLHVQFSDPAQEASFEMYSVEGLLIQGGTLSTSENTINISDLAFGCYILRMKLADGSTSCQKITKSQ